MVYTELWRKQKKRGTYKHKTQLQNKTQTYKNRDKLPQNDKDTDNYQCSSLLKNTRQENIFISSKS